ncbi:MAG: hypothetical protein CME68_07360 [Halobacteriovoraceae bacterium]|nr:hypothetical protein [Halobacteriovoraceae bacterium]
MNKVFRLIFLIFILSFSTFSNSKECDSCSIKVDSLEKPFSLAGNWLFTRDDNPSNKNLGISTDSWKKIKTPGGWKPAYKDGKIYEVGWYRGNFEFADNLIGQEVVFLVDTYMGEMNVYLDEKEIYSRGSRNAYERFYSVQAIPIRFKVTKRNHLIAFRVDTILMTGVYQRPFELRKFNKKDLNLAFWHVYGGEFRGYFGIILAAAGIFFLIVYFRTKNDFYFLPGMVGLGTFPFLIFPIDIVQKFFEPRQTFILHYVGIAITLLMHYKYTQFFARLHKFWESFYTFVLTIIAVLFIYLSINYHGKLFDVNRTILFAIVLVITFKMIYLTFKAMRAGKKGGTIFFCGETFLVITVLNDLMNSRGLLPTVGTVYLGMGVSTFAIVIIAINNYTNTYIQNQNLLVDLKALNDGLEEKVKERTRELAEKNEDINTMLHNLPQGVLTVVKGNIIHKEYSSYLEDIFETKEIANKNAIEFLFGNSTLSNDQISQVKTTVENFIGEDMLNYEVNEELLIKEICIKNPTSGSEKYLELLWSPIHSVDDEDTLEKILVCIRDITKIKALTAESEEQKKKIEMISQILKVLPDDFGEFIGSANKYIKENTELIKEKGELPPIGVMEQLFRNMHTIKGNARTHDFVYVSNAAHEAEQEYDQLRKGLKKDWDPSLLILHLEELEDALKIYEDVHDNVLGRGKEGSNETSSGSGKIKEDINEILNLVNTVNLNDPSKIREDLKTVSNRLFHLAAVNLESILSNLIKSLDSLAEDLEKEVPEVAIDDDGVLFNYEKSSALKDIFTHIIRNSIDHGIETPQEREKKGKSSKGKITIKAFEEEGFNKITIADDGQGLNIKKIKEKAIESGKLKSGDDVDPQTLANMVFLSGVSTAKEVTDVSGRGVGMDAVKSFLKNMGGDIEINFLNEQSSNGDMISFCWVIKIPKDLSNQSILHSEPA